MPPDVGVDRVDTVLFEFACQQGDLIPRLAVFDEVGNGLAHDHHEVGADSFADLFDDLDNDALAVLGATAPFVGAVVGAFAHEGVEEVALAAHDLDPVVTRLAR